MTETNLVGWGLAGLGALCGILAAYLQGGWVPALGAASTALTGFAVVWGYHSPKKV